MPPARTVRVFPIVLALAFGFGPMLALSGCGDSSKTEMVPPEDPAVKAKDSMDYYLKSMNKQKKGTAARAK
jgi:hypothetical protein